MKRKLFWLLAALAVLLGIYLFHPFLLNGMAHFLIVEDRLEPADIIVVLGGDDNGERVAAGVKLYKQGYAKMMLMTGGPLAWQLTAADWMEKQAISLGVPAKAILTERESRSTIENAEISLGIVKSKGFKKVILVTSPDHSRRALRVFRKIYGKNGIKVISHPVPLEESMFKLSGWWKRHEDTQRVVWEYVSLVYYFFKRY